MASIGFGGADVVGQSQPASGQRTPVAIGTRYGKDFIAVIDQNGEFRGLTCDVSSGSDLSTRGNYCEGYFIEGLSTGDRIDIEDLKTYGNRIVSSQKITTIDGYEIFLKNISSRGYIVGPNGTYVEVEDVVVIRSGSVNNLNEEKIREAIKSNKEKLERLGPGQITENVSISDENNLDTARNKANEVKDKVDAYKCDSTTNDDGDSIIKCSDSEGNPVTDFSGVSSNLEECASGTISLSGGAGSSWSCLSSDDSNRAFDSNRLINDEAEGEITGSTTNPLLKIGDKFLQFFLIIIATIVDITLWILANIAKLALFFITYALMWLILLNPAAPNFLNVIGELWGILAGLGNMIILGSMIFIGLTKVMDIKPFSDKSIGDIFLKLIYYGVLLNFSFFLGIFLVNLGYSLVYLLIISQGGNPSSWISSADSLLSPYMTAIGSYSRTTPGGAIGESISGGISAATSASIAQIGIRVVELAVYGITAFAFLKFAKVVLFQKVRVFFDLAFSAVALALYFNPIDKAKEAGQKLIIRLLVDSMFAPAVVGVFFIVGVFTTTFANIIETSPFELNNNTDDNIIDASITGLSSVVGIAIVGMMSAGALFLTSDWFDKSYEADIKAAGGAITKGVSALNKGVYRLSAPARYAAKNTGWGKKLTEQTDELASSDNLGLKAVGLASQGLGHFVTGRAGYKAANLATHMKELYWDSFANMEKRDLAGTKEQDAINFALASRKAPGVLGSVNRVLGNNSILPYRRVSAEALGQLDPTEEAQAAYDRGANAAFSTERSGTKEADLAELRSAIEKANGDPRKLSGDDNFLEVVTNAIKKNDRTILDAIGSNSMTLKAIRKAEQEGKIEDDEVRALLSGDTARYLSFNDDFFDEEGKAKDALTPAVQEIIINPNRTFSSVDLMNDEIVRIASDYYHSIGDVKGLQSLQEQVKAVRRTAQSAYQDTLPKPRGSRQGGGTPQYQQQIQKTKLANVNYTDTMSIKEQVDDGSLDIKQLLTANTDSYDYLNNNTAISRLLSKYGDPNTTGLSQREKEILLEERIKAIRQAGRQISNLENAAIHTAGVNMKIKSLEGSVRAHNQGAPIIDTARGFVLADQSDLIIREIEAGLVTGGLQDPNVAKKAAREIFLELTKLFTEPGSSVNLNQINSITAGNQTVGRYIGNNQGLQDNLAGVINNNNRGTWNQDARSRADIVVSEIIEKHEVGQNLQALEENKRRAEALMVGESIDTSGLTSL